MLLICTRLLFPKKTTQLSGQSSACLNPALLCGNVTQQALILNRNTLQTGLLYNTGFILGAQITLEDPLSP